MSNPLIELRTARSIDYRSLEEIARELHIPEQHLEAIENGEFSSLPDPIYTRRVIRMYAKFLNVDPNPILHVYRESQLYGQDPREADGITLAPTLSRSQTRRQNRKKSSSRFSIPSITSIPLPQNKWVLWGSVTSAFIVIIGLIWFLVSDDEPTAAESVQTTKTTEAGATAAVQNKQRPEVRLLKSSETYKYGDLFGISNANQIELKLTAKKPTEIRVRVDGPTGKIIAEKKLTPNKTETFTHDKWISLRVLQPQLVTISVNGVIIDSTNQKELHLYQFRIGTEEE